MFILADIPAKIKGYFRCFLWISNRFCRKRILSCKGMSVQNGYLSPFFAILYKRSLQFLSFCCILIPIINRLIMLISHNRINAPVFWRSFMESKTLISSIRENIGKVMVGSEETIDLLLTALIAEGHVLIEDVPGMGKTVLAKSLAKSVSLEFNRIQFTPDLLPSDVTGLNYFDQKANDFVFSPGPAFCILLLADEINRAPPRTQSSLLECMGERQTL